MPIKKPIKREVAIVNAHNQNIQKQINQMIEHSNGEIDFKEFVKVFQQNEINKSNSLKENEKRLVADYPTNMSVIRRLLQTKEQ